MKYNFYLKSKHNVLLTDIELKKEFKVGDMLTLNYDDGSNVYVVEETIYQINVTAATEWVDVYVR